MTRPIALALLAALAALPAPASAAPSSFVPGEILVKHAPGTAAGVRRAAAAARSHVVLSELRDGWTHLRLRPGESVEAGLAAWAADPAVEHAQPNFIYRASAVPDDPDFGQQWALRNSGQTISSTLQPPDGLIATDNPGAAGDDIGIVTAWSITSDCTGAVVAIVDTGVNYQHQDLAANMWDGGPSYPLHGWDFVDGDSDPMDRHGHGTHVAGIVGAAGNNGLGTTGVCWSARIMAVRVLDQFGVGTTVTIVNGMDFATSHGAKVVNMSLGGGGTFDAAYSAAFDRAAAAGVLAVVAAGNDGSNNDGGAAVYPCNFTQPNVVCVAALDQSYALATFSNYGATSVDVGAPGTNILSTWPGTNAYAVEAYASGWTGSSTTSGSGGGWAFGSLSGTEVLVNPQTYGSAPYGAGTDDRVWKAFDLSGASVVTVDLQAAIDLAPGDTAQIACKAGGGDPFAGGTTLQTTTGAQTHQAFISVSVDASPCIGPAATFGFRLTSGGGSAGGIGLVISPLAFKLLAYDTASYNTIAGTSMATPVVAGVAALLAAYNPSYGYADVASALVAAGRPLASLAGKTTSGKAVDAMAALAYVHPPTGLQAAVH